MDEKNKVDPIRSEFCAESSWRFGGEPYFFESDRESSILSEFGWNPHPETVQASGGDSGGVLEFHRMDPDEMSDLAGNQTLSESIRTRFAGPEVHIGPSADASTSNPSVSSSSSDDPPEKSTASGGKPPRETV